MNLPIRIVIATRKTIDEYKRSDEYKVIDVVESYRNYYRGAKSSFAVWKNREVPNWFNP